MQDLPGTAYAVGFVRTYADFLGFDGNSVVASYRDELGQRGRPEVVNWHIEEKDGGFPFGKLLVILLVIGAAGYGLWYYLANTQSGTGLIEAVPEYLKKSTGGDKAVAPAPATSQPASPPAGSTTPAAGSSSEAQPAGNSTEAQASTSATATPLAPTTGQLVAPTTSPTTGVAQPVTPAPAATPVTPVPGQAAAPSVTPPAGQATGQEPATTTSNVTTASPAATPAPTATQTAAVPSTASSASGEATPDVTAAASSSTTRISVRAKLESWVQINDKDGKSVMSKVLRAGETYAVPDQKGLVLNTGNAGGIEVVVDGKTLPSLGSIGLVKRNIALDPDKLTTGAVPPKAPANKTEPGADGAGAGTGTTTGD